MQRVISYIDGFNLYFGLKSKGYRRYYWLNIQQLSRSLLKQYQTLSYTKYFTSRVSSNKQDPDKSKRQAAYIEAVETLHDCSIYFGHYLSKKVVCHNCGSSWRTHEEKMTDVNIAIELMTDAFNNRFDTALLLSGDSDLTGPVKSVRDLFPNKRIIVAFPPNRHSKQLQMAANAFFTIGRKKIADSQFSDIVKKADGFRLARPTSWR